MLNRSRRFAHAIFSSDFTSWDKPNGFNYLRFKDLGFEVSNIEDIDFKNMDFGTEEKPSMVNMPTKKNVISISNGNFSIEFTYLISDLSQMLNPSTIETHGSTSVQHYFKISDQDLFDAWLDDLVWERKINMSSTPALMPKGNKNPDTGADEFDITVGGVTRKVSIMPDGNISITGNGQSLTMDNGGVSADLSKIKKVSIDNVIDLVSYSCTKHPDRTFHIFDFSDGGRGEITYGATGRLEIFSITKARVTITNDSTIILGIYERDH